jgi:hypothetical protein
MAKAHDFITGFWPIPLALATAAQGNTMLMDVVTFQKKCDGARQIRHTHRMQSAAIRKWVLALTLLAFIFWAIVHFYNLSAQKSGNLTRIILEPLGDYSYRQPKMPVSKTNQPAATAQKNLRQRIEEWLALHHRSANSLLAAFQMMDEPNYLKEAATNFPDNPRVELTVLAHNTFPEDRRRWLDLYKASSPSNSLANYLSAQTYFQTGQSEAAVKDLVAATGKPYFDNYSLESQLDTEELGLFCGESPLKSIETARAGSTADATLALIRQLASQMADLQKQELNVGDTDSAENLAQMGTILGDQLGSGASGNYIANQLAAIAIESMMLEQLNSNAGYDFLGGETRGERLRELRDQKAVLTKLMTDFYAVNSSLKDAEKVNFQERVKIYGEVAAMRRVVQQQGDSPGSP